MAPITVLPPVLPFLLKYMGRSVMTAWSEETRMETSFSCPTRELTSSVVREPGGTVTWAACQSPSFSMNSTCTSAWLPVGLPTVRYSRKKPPVYPSAK